MGKIKKLSINKDTKVLVSAEQYDFSADTRLLIPFTSWDKIGFVNRTGEIVVSPEFTMCYGECYSEEDFIRVSVTECHGYPRSGGKVATYQRPLYGLINHKGEKLLDTVYQSIVPAIGNKALFTVNKDRKYGVVNAQGELIVPFGTYDWIDGFERGLARVKIGRASSNLAHNGNKWGVIDEQGNVVLPIEYKAIWNFYGKSQYSDIIVTTEDGKNVILEDFIVKNGYAEERNEKKCRSRQSYVYDCSCGDNYRSQHYEEFAGTYAQDVAGYSDEDIYDAFDGDPEAYWNID